MHVLRLNARNTNNLHITKIYNIKYCTVVDFGLVLSIEGRYKTYWIMDYCADLNYGIVKRWELVKWLFSNRK